MKKSIVLVALLVMAGCFTMSSAKNAAGPKKVIDVQLYSVRDDIRDDFKGVIAQLAKAGITGVETANYNDGKFYGLTPQEFKKAIQDAGMEVLSAHTGKSLAHDVASTDWDEIWKWWDTAIAAHKAAGMKYIVTPSIPRPQTLADLQVYCDYLNKIGEKCNAAGMRFGYHNHHFEFVEIEGQLMYDYLLQHTDPAKVFFEMDVFWTIMGDKSPVDYFNKYPGRFLLLHVKDNKELGQSGMVGFDAIFKNLKIAGAKRLVMEVEQYNFKPIESIQMSVEYLRKQKELDPFFQGMK